MLGAAGTDVRTQFKCSIRLPDELTGQLFKARKGLPAARFWSHGAPRTFVDYLRLEGSWLKASLTSAGESSEQAASLAFWCRLSEADLQRRTLRLGRLPPGLLCREAGRCQRRNDERAGARQCASDDLIDHV